MNTPQVCLRDFTWTVRASSKLGAYREPWNMSAYAAQESGGAVSGFLQGSPKRFREADIVRETAPVCFRRLRIVITLFSKKKLSSIPLNRVYTLLT